MVGPARRLFPPDLMALALVIGLSVDCMINKGVRAVKADTTRDSTNKKYPVILGSFYILSTFRMHFTIAE
ncbi:uncharacterized protein N7498_005850 [Penicillium cinerascens]|uniref:Uncharacterized protein n=1 Tax=Penicillium cinerascens TaxID=70096 RepID=A0A9W9MP82_9EURO|nr:uncharacterized protein N7498_005850 [Penicillium cinerascens]KAJ5204971.1 hypothetical protein N7498_005850 [Penicillium cinerascens]